MKTKTSAVSIFLLLSLVLGQSFVPSTVNAATCDQALELVNNGSFEAPVVTHPDKWDAYPGSTPSLMWGVEWASNAVTVYHGNNRPNDGMLELQQNGHLGYSAQDGNQYAELDADWFGPTAAPDDEPASVNIFQDIQTIPGATYTLKFYFAARPDTLNAADNVLKVRWDNIDVASLTDTPNGNQIQWMPYTYTLTATAATTRVEFSDQGTGNSIGTYLDAVSIKCDTAPVVVVVPPGGGGGVPPGGNGGVVDPQLNPNAATAVSGGGGGGTSVTSTPTPVVITPVSTTTGQVLGIETDIPSMPSTGMKGFPYITLAALFLVIAAIAESLVFVSKRRNQ